MGIAILGSTGSIGESALRVIERHPERFEVTVLTANRSVEALDRQARAHHPATVVVTDEEAYSRCADDGTHRDTHRGTHWVGGREELLDAVARPDVDVVVNALVGFAGLEPSIRALEAGKRLALANKESLVAGGDLVLRALERGGGQLVPVDSEHSAIFQCLEGRPPTATESGGGFASGPDANDPLGASVSRLILTASGGPFRGWDPDRLREVRPADALDHPTWDMGAKITVDSATLANKALEVIEAHLLYGIPYDRIEAVVHPQSIIHSFVEFVDGSVMAQLGFPTMELPILYALTYPHRAADAELRTFDPVRASPLTFEPVDEEGFPLFTAGIEAGRMGGTAPAVFNAANEVVVAAFLEERVSFPGMARVVRETMKRIEPSAVESIEDVLEADRTARRTAHDLLESAPGSDA